jgi:hypothetical protein
MVQSFNTTCQDSTSVMVLGTNSCCIANNRAVCKHMLAWQQSLGVLHGIVAC